MGEHDTCRNTKSGPCSSHPDLTAYFMNDKRDVLMEIRENGEVIRHDPPPRHDRDGHHRHGRR